jgi:hypothetical protein
MNETTHSHRKMVLFALASVALLTPALHAQTITTSVNDLILGFRADGAPGQTLNIEVDLGNVSQFYNAAPGSTIPLPSLAIQDLINAYGASWSTRTDLWWGAVSTTGRVSGTPDGHAPAGTLWATAPVGQTPFNRASVFTQKAASPTIEAMITPSPGGGGQLYGASSTPNSANAAVINASLANSWTLQDQKTIGASFAYFNPTVDNTADIPPGGQVASVLYELQPTTVTGVVGTALGQLVLTQSGLSFQTTAAPSVFQITSLVLTGADAVVSWKTTGITTNVVQAANGGLGGSYNTNNFQDISGPIIIGTAGVTTANFTDVGGATNRPSRFYRIRLGP